MSWRLVKQKGSTLLTVWEYEKSRH